MISITTGFSLDDRTTAAMFEDRKQLFVDLLRWDIPVVAERYEIDAFDGSHATYLMSVGADGGHDGSLRLLPTERPHILSSLFPALCDGPVPSGADVVEITRLCLPVRLGAARRLGVRNRLITAMVDHALGNGIATLTGVVSWTFLEQIMAMGWACRALGTPTMIGGARLGAFAIALDDDTPARLSRIGIYGGDGAALRAAA